MGWGKLTAACAFSVVLAFGNAQAEPPWSSHPYNVVRLHRGAGKYSHFKYHADIHKIYRLTRDRSLARRGVAIIPAEAPSGNLHYYPFGHGTGRISDPQMRSFWELVEHCAPSRPLDGFEIFGVQHLLGSTGGLLRALANSGVSPKNIHILGKIYSESDLAEDELFKDQFKSVKSKRYWNLRGFPYSSEQTQGNINTMVKQLLNRARENIYAKFLIMDDGGKLLDAVGRSILFGEAPPDLASRIVGVEQTPGGLGPIKNGYVTHVKTGHSCARGLRKLRFPFPVVDMAESWMKVVYEPPLIGRSATNCILQTLTRLRSKGVSFISERPQECNVLFVGLGRVNTPVALSLMKMGFKVGATDIAMGAVNPATHHRVLDKDTHLFKRALRLGLPEQSLFADIDDALKTFAPQILISATGKNVLKIQDIRTPRTDPLVMINLGSEGSEFPEFVALGQKHLDKVQQQELALIKYKSRPSYHLTHGDEFRSNWVKQSCLGVNYTRFIMNQYRHDYRLADLYVDLRGQNKGEFIIPYGGNPLNFGGVDPIPPKFIQLTRAASYICALEAAQLINHPICRSHPLNMHQPFAPLFMPPLDIQRWFVNRWKKELAEEGLFAIHPEF